MPTRRSALLAALAATATPAVAQQQRPAAPLTLAVAGSDAPGQVEHEYGPLCDAFQRLAGREIRLFPMGNPSAAAEALNERRIDLVLTGPAEYVVFRTRTQAVPVVALTRIDYFANIAVLARGHVQVPDDLVGQRVAFGDAGSTSRHLGPMQVLADLGLHPRRDIQALHIPDSAGVEALLRGDVAAIAVNHTDIARLRDRLPDTPLRVIARGRDLPDDVLVAGQHVPAGTVEAVRRVFVEHAADMTQALTADGRNRKYIGGAFLPDVRDADYNYVRLMYRTVGQPRLSEFIGN